MSVWEGASRERFRLPASSTSSLIGLQRRHWAGREASQLITPLTPQTPHSLRLDSSADLSAYEPTDHG